MGITAFINLSLVDNFKEIIQENSTPFSCGLAVCQKSSTSFYVTHLVPFSENGTEGVSTSKSKPFQSIKESAVASHSEQVIRLLPGGLDVLGIYLLMSPSTVKENTPKVKSVLSAIRKSAASYYLGSIDYPEDMIVLCGDPKTLDISVLSLNVESSPRLDKGLLKTEMSSWFCLNFSYSLNYSIFFPSDRKLQSLRRNVLSAMVPWAEGLRETLVLVDGRPVTDDEKLVTWSTARTPTKHTANAITNCDVQILEKSRSKSPESVGIQNYSGSVAFSGTVAGRAYAVSKISNSELLDIIQRDLVRSFVSRWTMHCDSLVEEPQGTSTGFVIHEPPRRVFAKEDEDSFALCDYLFPGDSVADACHSISEIFELAFSPNLVDDSLETWADPEELVAAEEKNSETNGLERVFWLRRSISVQIGAAILSALLAIFLAYLFISKS